VCIFVVIPLGAQEYHQLLDSETRDLLHEALRGELAKMVKQVNLQLDKQHESLTGSLRSTVQRRGLKSKKPPALDKNPDTRVVVRLTRGSLASGIPETKLPAQDATWYRTAARSFGRNGRFEIGNFIDGKRNVSEIRNTVSAEYGPMETRLVARYLDDLVRASMAEWKVFSR
jgi:hypothetical protein